MLSFATFAVGFLMRPVGGLVFGHIGDRIGRKRTLALTMAIMGGSTALMGALPTAAAIGVAAPILLLALRMLQGFALGGEWAGAVLLAVEHSPRRKVGLFGSYPQVGLALGLALGTGVFALLRTVLSEDAFLAYGWRIAFGASVVLVLIGLVVRLKIDETPAFREVNRLNRISKVPVVELFRSARSRRNTVLGLLSRWGEGAAFNTWGVFAISFATVQLGFEQVPVLLAVTVAAVVMAALIPVSGLLTDRFGPRRVLPGSRPTGCWCIRCSCFSKPAISWSSPWPSSQCSGWRMGSSTVRKAPCTPDCIRPRCDIRVYRSSISSPVSMLRG